MIKWLAISNTEEIMAAPIMYGLRKRLKLMPLLTVVVPLADLRNVPALSNRGKPPTETRVAAFWTWNNAPPGW